MSEHCPDCQALEEEIQRLQKRNRALEVRQRRADVAMVAVLEYRTSDWARAVERAREVVLDLRRDTEGEG